MTAPADLDDEGVGKIVTRRERVRGWWDKVAGTTDAKWDAAHVPEPVGLALSGGGIRSATFSLGLIQALAKAHLLPSNPRDALGNIDVLSTVSGGGYVGCFLRSLFVPQSLRGIEVPPGQGAPSTEIADQYRLARTVLASEPCSREIAWPGVAGGKLRNPLWWLREHSRYLAPTGMTDYGFAVAYIARNWLAMTFLVLLACIGIGALLVGAETGVLALAREHGGVAWTMPFSPLFALAAAPVAAIAVLMIAYWATQAMSTNEAKLARQRTSLAMATGLILVAAAASVALVALADGLPGGATALDDTFVLIIGLGVGVSVIGAARAWLSAARLGDRGALLSTELRRRLTLSLAHANYWLLAILVVAAIDTSGALLVKYLREPKVGGITAALLPVLAFLIKKLPDWFGGGSGRANPGGGIGGLLRRFASTVAFVLGLVLYAVIAVAALALVHEVTLAGEGWAGTLHLRHWLVLSGIAWTLGVVIGVSNGFINLSSLHALYASRLTRAYLGASNTARLTDIFTGRTVAPVTENHAKDYIQPRVYGGTDLPAPIHIINVTLNETIDPRSQIVSRDRKGDILSVEPDGVRVEDRLIAWNALVDPSLPKTSRAENISLGQWIAISGAAASAGMGRMTSLGFALAFTFANVRLGYWWWSPGLFPKAPEVTGLNGLIAKVFGTFVYLGNEMTCRYSKGYRRKYLTDGGHYENSGAYVLIRRRVPLIVVTDNGADPDYAFADLETLVRQVRIDLGAETTILGGAARNAVLAELGATGFAIFVEPGAVADKDPDWRRRMTDPTDPSYVLVLRVVVGGETLHMLWIKPRMIPGVPTDIAGYQLAMKSFPQQPTGDQFFDEAQWESYRRLGELSMTRLLEACPKLLA